MILNKVDTVQLYGKRYYENEPYSSRDQKPLVVESVFNTERNYYFGSLVSYYYRDRTLAVTTYVRLLHRRPRGYLKTPLQTRMSLFQREYAGRVNKCYHS